MVTDAEYARRSRERRYAEIEKMPKIPCACGCGTLIPPINRRFKPATYVRGHQPGGENTRFKPGQKAWNEGLPNPIAVETHAGKKKPLEAIAKREATRRAKKAAGYTYPRGWKRTPENIQRWREANPPRYGTDNPFYGRSHTEDALRRISDKNSGENNPNWRGGVSTLPYGPEFTRKYRRLLRERDNYTCQRCGKTQEENGRTLQIHHIDHDKMNNDPANLVTVCNACNIWCSYHRDEPFQPLKKKD